MPKPTNICTDQLGHRLRVPERPQRIVSLVPSLTELLVYLGLQRQLVGITKFCIHPPKLLREKTKVGGTKKLHHDRIHDLQPDLIIANKEENRREDVEALADRYPVWVSYVRTLQEAYTMMEGLGQAMGKAVAARKLAATLKARFADRQSLEPPVRTAYFIWRKPWMCAGSDTFINHILKLWGMENIFAGEAGRYPEASLDQLRKLRPQLILLSDEPFPFKEKHAEEIRERYNDAQIRLVNGSLFSWYGSRLLRTPDYLNKIAIKVQR